MFFITLLKYLKKKYGRAIPILKTVQNVNSVFYFIFIIFNVSVNR